MNEISLINKNFSIDFIPIHEVIQRTNLSKNSILQRAIDGIYPIYGMLVMLGLPRGTKLTSEELKVAISSHLDAGWNGEVMVDSDAEDEWPKDLLPITCPERFQINLHNVVLEQFLDGSESYVFDNIPIKVGDLRKGASNPPKQLPKDDNQYVTFRLNSRAVLRESSLRMDSFSFLILEQEIKNSPIPKSTIPPKIESPKITCTPEKKPTQTDELDEVLIRIFEGIKSSAINDVFIQIRQEMNLTKRKYDTEKVLLQWEERSDGNRDLVWKKNGKEKSIKISTLKNRLTKLRKKQLIS